MVVRNGAREVGVAAHHPALASMGEEGPHPPEPGPQIEDVANQRLTTDANSRSQVVIRIEQERVGVSLLDQPGGLEMGPGADANNANAEVCQFGLG